MEKTAIEWFVNKLDNWGIKSLRDRETIIKQAKEIKVGDTITLANERNNYQTGQRNGEGTT